MTDQKANDTSRIIQGDAREVLRGLSWGCGVQSTTLAVMSALGDMGKLDVVITADTGWERQATYDIRDFYAQWLTDRGVAVEIVSGGNIRDIHVRGESSHIHMPLWTGGGPLKRQCTRDFKIRPIKRRLRELIGFHASNPPHPKKGAIELWLGISLDEWTRANPSRVQFIEHRWPLLERRVSRNDCIDYLERKGLPVPIKSACIGCPFRSASEYLAMRRDCPREWRDAVAFDAAIRHKKPSPYITADSLYIRRETKPLDEIDLELAAKHERLGVQMPLLVCDSGYCMT